MNHSLLMLAGSTLLFCSTATAHRGDVDVMVPVSPEIWGAAKSTVAQPTAKSCSRCCIYQGQNYSEGAVLKVEGEALQCVRDPNVVGTNPLIWVRLKK